ncbi:hypothetical protein G7Y79_00011g030390 [Physcia stellaris]|nr:hypothetical protein G7Y79_00011g030390 [Physcia stellaris]
MGLGGGRKRTKLSHDPNNTTWSRSSDGYGQRLLQSKGWTPGASLGARGKPYTRPKDTSYIRVALKDDTLGLGAKSGVNLPPTGLDAFQGLLGRLNGKQEDELEKEQRTRDDLRRAVYTENKWGALRFVSGGFLVGDKIEEAVEDIPGTEISIPTEKEAPANPHAPQPDLEPLITATDTDAKNMSKKSKKPKKSRKSGVRDLLGNQRIGDERTTCDSDPISPEREAREAMEAMEAHVENTDTSKGEKGKSAQRVQRKLDRRQKKMALMDPKALNEILMIKV